MHTFNHNNKHTFIFVCGLHRSGTTIVADLLKKHPAVSGFENTNVPKDEGQFLQTVFPPARKYGAQGSFGFAPQMHMTEKSALNTPENAHAIFSQWSSYWNLEKPYLLEKSPPNLLKTRFLQALFPNSYFVVIVRHPAITSLATRKWSKKPLRLLLRHWVWCHYLYRKDRGEIRNLIQIKYEDFVKAPSEQLESIYNFIGLPSEDIAVNGVKDQNAFYHEQWMSRLNQLPFYIAYRLLFFKSEKEVNKFGYSLFNRNKLYSCES